MNVFETSIIPHVSKIPHVSNNSPDLSYLPLYAKYIIEYHEAKMTCERKFLSIDAKEYIEYEEITIDPYWIDNSFKILCKIKLEYIKSIFNEIPDVALRFNDMSYYDNIVQQKDSVVDFLAKHQSPMAISGSLCQISSKQFIRLMKDNIHLLNIDENYLRSLTFFPYTLTKDKLMELLKEHKDNKGYTSEIINKHQDKIKLTEEEIQYLMDKKQTNTQKLRYEKMHLPSISTIELSYGEFKKQEPKEYIECLMTLDLKFNYLWWETQLKNKHEKILKYPSISRELIEEFMAINKSLVTDLPNITKNIKNNKVFTEFITLHNIEDADIPEFIDHIGIEISKDITDKMMQKYDDKTQLNSSVRYIQKFTELMCIDMFDLHVLSSYLDSFKDYDLIITLYRYIAIVMGNHCPNPHRINNGYYYFQSKNSNTIIVKQGEDTTIPLIGTLLYIDLSNMYKAKHPSYTNNFLQKIIRNSEKLDRYHEIMPTLKDIEHLNSSLCEIGKKNLGLMDPRCLYNRYYQFFFRNKSIKSYSQLKVIGTMHRELDFKSLEYAGNQEARMDAYQDHQLIHICEIFSDKNIPFGAYHPEKPITLIKFFDMSLKGIRLLQKATHTLTLTNGNILNSLNILQQLCVELLYFHEKECIIKTLSIQDENSTISPTVDLYLQFIYIYICKLLQIKLFINDNEYNEAKYSIETIEKNDNFTLNEILNNYNILINDLYIRNFDDTLIEKDKSIYWSMNSITKIVRNIYIENVNYSSDAFYFLCMFSSINNTNIFIKEPTDIKSEYRKYQHNKHESEYLKIHKEICLLKIHEMTTNNYPSSKIPHDMEYVIYSHNHAQKILIIDENDKIYDLISYNENQQRLQAIFEKFDLVFIIRNKKYGTYHQDKGLEAKFSNAFYLHSGKIYDTNYNPVDYDRTIIHKIYNILGRNLDLDELYNLYEEIKYINGINTQYKPFETNKYSLSFCRIYQEGVKQIALELKDKSGKSNHTTIKPQHRRTNFKLTVSTQYQSEISRYTHDEFIEIQSKTFNEDTRKLMLKRSFSKIARSKKNSNNYDNEIFKIESELDMKIRRREEERQLKHQKAAEDQYELNKFNIETYPDINASKIKTWKIFSEYFDSEQHFVNEYYEYYMQSQSKYETIESAKVNQLDYVRYKMKYNNQSIRWYESYTQYMTKYHPDQIQEERNLFVYEYLNDYYRKNNIKEMSFKEMELFDILSYNMYIYNQKSVNIININEYLKNTESMKFNISKYLKTTKVETWKVFRKTLNCESEDTFNEIYQKYYNEYFEKISKKQPMSQLEHLIYIIKNNKKTIDEYVKYLEYMKKNYSNEIQEEHYLFAYESLNEYYKQNQLPLMPKQKNSFRDTHNYNNCLYQNKIDKSIIWKYVKNLFYINDYLEETIDEEEWKILKFKSKEEYDDTYRKYFINNYENKNVMNQLEYVNFIQQTQDQNIDLQHQYMEYMKTNHSGKIHKEHMEFMLYRINEYKKSMKITTNSNQYNEKELRLVRIYNKYIYKSRESKYIMSKNEYSEFDRNAELGIDEYSNISINKLNIKTHNIFSKHFNSKAQFSSNYLQYYNKAITRKYQMNKFEYIKYVLTKNNQNMEEHEEYLLYMHKYHDNTIKQEHYLFVIENIDMYLTEYNLHTNVTKKEINDAKNENISFYNLQEYNRYLYKNKAYKITIQEYLEYNKYLHEHKDDSHKMTIKEYLEYSDKLRQAKIKEQSKYMDDLLFQEYLQRYTGYMTIDASDYQEYLRQLRIVYNIDNSNQQMLRNIVNSQEGQQILYNIHMIKMDQHLLLTMPSNMRNQQQHNQQKYGKKK